jgi:anti-sigma factor RsiW
MYNCKKIKDLILTDYVDTQLDPQSKSQVEDHLRHCAVCQAFAKEVKECLIVPFEKSSRQEVPVHLWDTIKDRILQEEVHPQSLRDVILGWLQGITFPRLVPALVSFVMVFFISSTIFLDWQTKQAQEQEQGAYVEYMLSSAATNQKDNHDLGTPIEQYFL